MALACSGLHTSRYPLPHPEQLLDIEDGEARLRRALELLYDYYEQHESLLANVARDVEVDEITQEMVYLRTGATMDRYARS